MLKFLIGPALTAVAYVAGSYYGSSAQQIVRKPLGHVYSEVAGAVASMPHSGAMRFADGSEVPYDLSIEGTPDQRLRVTLVTQGKQMAAADISFAPQDNGQATLLTLTVDADNTVLREAFADTPKSRIGYAPDWMFNLAMKPVLHGVAEQIEQGAALRSNEWIGGQSDPRAGWTAEQRRAEQEWQQYDASRPMVDPNAAANRQMQGGN